MIKIRQGSFETNSSSVHTLAWCNSYYKIDEEEYEDSKTNIIDLSCNEDEGSFRLFSKKIQKLYTFLNDNEVNILENFLENYEYDSNYIYFEDAYSKNIEVNGIKFRDFYNSLKINLLEVIEELTGKKAEILNEELFEYHSHDMSGFIPVEKDDIREVLLNKDIRIVYEDNFGCDEEDEYLSIGRDALSSAIKKRKQKEEQNNIRKDDEKLSINLEPIVTSQIGTSFLTNNSASNSKEIYLLISEYIQLIKKFDSKPSMKDIEEALNIKNSEDLVGVAKVLYEGERLFKVNNEKFGLIKLEV